jgi:diguanylate cyclase (GGDEF)-like protein
VRSDEFAGAVLDALPTRVALVGADRTVLHVNEAWRRGAADGGDPFWAALGGRWPPAAPSTGGDASGLARLADATDGMIAHERDRADLEVAHEAGRGERWLHVRMRRPPSGTGVVVAVDDITARHAKEDELRYDATHDLVTGLANRALFASRLKAALAVRPVEPDRHAVAVIFLDLDAFRRVNTAHGHAAGDLVLRAAGRRLAQALRPDDLLARWGGDEFVVLTTAVTSPDAMRLAEDLTRAFAEPLEIGARSIPMSVSVGMALSGADRPGPSPLRPDPSPLRPDPFALVDQAGDALLRARGQARNRPPNRRGR